MAAPYDPAQHSSEYSVEYSPSNRATCRGHKAVCQALCPNQLIPTGELRLRHYFERVDDQGVMPMTVFHHWRCVDPKLMDKVIATAGHKPAGLPGYDQLRPEDQAKVDEAFAKQCVPQYVETKALLEAGRDEELSERRAALEEERRLREEASGKKRKRAAKKQQDEGEPAGEAEAAADAPAKKPAAAAKKGAGAGAAKKAAGPAKKAAAKKGGRKRKAAAAADSSDGEGDEGDWEPVTPQKPPPRAAARSTPARAARSKLAYAHSK